MSRRVSDSNKRSSAESAYKNGQSCSLLCHPLGLLLLENYCKLVLATSSNVNVNVNVTRTSTCSFPSSDSIPNEELRLIERLQGKVADFLQKELHEKKSWTETTLTGSAKDKKCQGKPSGLYKCFSESLFCNVATQTETEGDVFSWSSQSLASKVGRLDIAFGHAKTSNLNLNVNSTENHVDVSDLVGILEASVEANGGLQKLTQGLDYASLLYGQKHRHEVVDYEKFPEKEYFVVWTLHVNSCSTTNTTTGAAVATSKRKRGDDDGDNKAPHRAPNKRVRVKIGVSRSKSQQRQPQQQQQQQNQRQQQPRQQEQEQEQERDTKKIKDIVVHVYLCETSWWKDDNSTDSCPRSRYALLWRECTTVTDNDQGTDKMMQRMKKMKEVEAIKKGALSIARAVATVLKLGHFTRDPSGKRELEAWTKAWTSLGPNCAKVDFGVPSKSNDSEDTHSSIDNHHTDTRAGALSSAAGVSGCRWHFQPGTLSPPFMIKIFDNRMNPTARSPHMWCRDDTCSQDLEVQPFLLFHEGCLISDDTASYARNVYVCCERDSKDDTARDVKEVICRLSEDGRPKEETASALDQELLGNPRPGFVEGGDLNAKIRSVHFGAGTVVILRYKYIEGSHLPERRLGFGSPRSFLPILDQLHAIHKAGYVHGDVRLFNMVFAKTKTDSTEKDDAKTGSAEKDNAVLLDYDLGGLEGNRTYPSGYQRRLDDIEGLRAGIPNKAMTFRDDYVNLIRVMDLFELRSGFLEKALKAMIPQLQSSLTKEKTKLEYDQGNGLSEERLSKVEKLLENVEKMLAVVRGTSYEDTILSSLDAAVDNHDIKVLVDDIIVLKDQVDNHDIKVLVDDITVLKDQVDIIKNSMKGWNDTMGEILDKKFGSKTRAEAFEEMRNLLELDQSIRQQLSDKYKSTNQEGEIPDPQLFFRIAPKKVRTLQVFENAREGGGQTATCSPEPRAAVDIGRGGGQKYLVQPGQPDSVDPS